MLKEEEDQGVAAVVVVEAAIEVAIGQAEDHQASAGPSLPPQPQTAQTPPRLERMEKSLRGQVPDGSSDCWESSEDSATWVTKQTRKGELRGIKKWRRCTCSSKATANQMLAL